jgi:uncharacterized protein GlcG (DUF336 family)
MKIQRKIISGLMGLGLSLTATSAFADCEDLPNFSQLKTALIAAVAASTTDLDNQMWATLVARDGTVCAVAFSGSDFKAQWLGSRVISAQKANTANDFSLSHLVLSTANLYSAVQPGGSLYGLQHSNPVDTEVAYSGKATEFGQRDDPMVGNRIGGVNVFGGGLALYRGGTNIGGVGVSGDTSCRDHNVAWLVRANLKLDNLAGVTGVSGDPTRPDNIVFDIAPNPDGGTGLSKGGFGHPTCLIGKEADERNAAASLPVVH